MNLILPDGSEQDLGRYELSAEKAIHVPPLTMGVIPHLVFLKPCKTPVILVPKAGVFRAKNLWVECSEVSEGKIYTNVFNMSNDTVKVKKGDVLSMLIQIYHQIDQERVEFASNLLGVHVEEV